MEPGVWFEYEIEVQGDDYTVFLTNLQSGQRTRTTHSLNTDTQRGRAPGYIGIQASPEQHGGLATHSHEILAAVRMADGRDWIGMGHPARDVTVPPLRERAAGVAVALIRKARELLTLTHPQ